MIKDDIKLCRCDECQCVVTFVQKETFIDCPECQEIIEPSKTPATWDDLDAYLRSHANG